jgi:hypothetical protein
MGVTITLSDAQALEFSEAASARWESLVGYAPFFGSNDVTRTFNCPNNSGHLLLDGPMWRVDDVAIDGTSLASGTDWWKPSASGPWTYLVLNNRILGNPQEISVNGMWAWSQYVPEEVWQAIMDSACAQIVRITQGATGPVAEIQQESVKIKYAGSDGGAFGFADQADKRMEKLAADYRVTMFR